MITQLDNNTALILIDLQKGILKFDAQPHSLKTVIENSALLIESFRTKKLPIVIVNVNPVGAKWTKARVEEPALSQNKIKQSLVKVAIQFTHQTEIVPEIKTLPTDIFVTKHTWGAFFETGLHDALQKRKVTGIVLAGVSTSIGVEGTARQASELGYNLSIVTDATSDRNEAAHNNSFRFIFPRIAETGSTKDIITKLSEIGK